MSRPTTITGCLEALGIKLDSLVGCPGLKEEFVLVKKSYHVAILKAHPDKGGDKQTFMRVRASFEVLKRVLDSGYVSFQDAVAADNERAAAGDEEDILFDGPIPSWQFYEAAAEEAQPIYRVERAKSSRSSCVQVGKHKLCVDAKIPLGELRVGSLNEKTGSYTRWMHLRCCRVPSRVWAGLPDPLECHDRAAFRAAIVDMDDVLLSGVRGLTAAELDAVVGHFMDKAHWARKLARRRNPEAAPRESRLAVRNGVAVPHDVLKAAARKRTDQARKRPPSNAAPAPAKAAAAAAAAGGGSQLAARKKARKPGKGAGGRFVVPSPKDIPSGFAHLKGKRFAMTGVFPELGGGGGLDLGKARLRAMIESFGGRVTSSISGRTDFLVRGQNPGFSKVSKARAYPRCQLVDLQTLRESLDSGKAIEDAVAAAPPVLIKSFSSGYGGNGLAYHASPAALALAATGVDLEGNECHRSASLPAIRYGR